MTAVKQTSHATNRQTAEPIVRSEQYEQALREMRRRAPDIEKARRLLERANTSGDRRATYALATWYLHGKPPVVRRNRPKALKLLTTAADANISDALFDLAVSREKGELGQPDLRLAFELYLRAALNGDLQAVYEVGRCYHYGIGIKADRRLARIWLDHAADLGVGADDSANA